MTYRYNSIKIKHNRYQVSLYAVRSVYSVLVDTFNCPNTVKVKDKYNVYSNNWTHSSYYIHTFTSYQNNIFYEICNFDIAFCLFVIRKVINSVDFYLIYTVWHFSDILYLIYTVWHFSDILYFRNVRVIKLILQ